MSHKDNNRTKLEEEIRERKQKDAETEKWLKAKKEEKKRQLSALKSKYGNPEKIIRMLIIAGRQSPGGAVQ